MDVEKSLTLDKLVRTRWAFGPSDGEPITTRFRFGNGGAIEGYSHPNEASWTFENGRLEILSADGSPMWRSDHLFVRQGSLHIALTAPKHPGACFTLYECTADGRLGYGGATGLSTAEFLFPNDLQVTPTAVKRVLLVGSCLTELYHRTFQARFPEIQFDYILMHNASDVPETPPSPVESYDFQYLQFPLRTVISDRIVTRLRLSDPSFVEELYADGCAIIDAMLEASMAYNKAHGLLAFVSTFIVPQGDIVPSIGKRMGPCDLVALVRRLNDHVAVAVRRYRNVYICDVDAVASSIGKRFFLDDVTGFYAHGSTFGQDGVDLVPGARIETVPHISTFYESKADEFLEAVFLQAVATYRTVRQIDQVKAVVFDLDNTLWRGQIAEDYSPERAPWPRGGWQIGIWEAIQHLRARGILVAVCSKNDLDVVQRHWDNVIEPPFVRLDDFASLKIDWKPKAENIEEICREFNILPKSVVFVDDNPVEREAVRFAMPDIRTIGSNPYLTRRILLWAPETQVAELTAETAGREASIRGAIKRERNRAQMSRQEFLASLECIVAFIPVTSVEQPEFARVLELTNKTNQFNTTGKRWTMGETSAFMAGGGSILAFRVMDKFSDYGLVGVLYVKDGVIVQYVMSCRVLGMDVEVAALARVASLVRADADREITAELLETAANGPCRDVFSRAGFEEIACAGERRRFRLASGKRLSPPGHIRMMPTGSREEMPAKSRGSTAYDFRKWLRTMGRAPYEEKR